MDGQCGNLLLGRHLEDMGLIEDFSTQKLLFKLFFIKFLVSVIFIARKELLKISSASTTIYFYLKLRRYILFTNYTIK